MVEPGDFLVKIAKKEYGDFKLWKYIYEWNKEQIGDNPNIIYPYNFFDLQKVRKSHNIWDGLEGLRVDLW